AISSVCSSILGPRVLRLGTSFGLAFGFVRPVDGAAPRGHQRHRSVPGPGMPDPEVGGFYPRGLTPTREPRNARHGAFVPGCGELRGSPAATGREGDRSETGKGKDPETFGAAAPGRHVLYSASGSI